MTALIILLALPSWAIEGFYSQGEAKALASRFGISPSVVELAEWKLAAFQGSETRNLKRDFVSYYLKYRCTDRSSRPWFEETCQALEKAKCEKEECKISANLFLCAGVVIDGYFVSAHHCIDDLPSGVVPTLLIRDQKHKNVVKLPLEDTPKSRQFSHHEFTVFKIRDWLELKKKHSFAKTELRSTDATPGETVFGVGFPRLSNRKRFQEKYNRTPSGVAFTFGKVVDANLQHQAFCTFSNWVEDLKPETWKLEDDCKSTDYKKFDPKFRVHEERDPMLTDTDMTFGMSGSPLFDREGKVVGIGTTVLSSDPYNYASGKPAVYIKSTRIIETLNQFRSN